MPERGRIAHAYDFDDTLLNRSRSIRVGALIFRRIFQRHHDQLPPIDSISPLVRDVRETPITTLGELISYAHHSIIGLIPGVKEVLEADKAEGVDIYGITGRSNKRPWVDMTNRTLEKEGIEPLFTDVLFTPKGYRTAVSKADGLRTLQEMYEEVEFSDDDPETIAYLAGQFPDITFNYVHYGSTGLIYSEMEHRQFPNVHSVSIIGEQRS